jgi:uncharacterized delta-60 repeat protein
LGVALQTDGKIVAAGRSKVTGAAGCHMAVARFNTDGNLDTSFGDGGIAVGPVTSSGDDVALQADGKIVAVGASGYWMLARFAGDAPAGMQALTAMESFQAPTDTALGSLSSGQCKAASTVAAKTATDSVAAPPSPAASSVLSAPAATPKSGISSASRRSSAPRTVDEALAALAVDDLKIEPTSWRLARDLT